MRQSLTDIERGVLGASKFLRAPVPDYALLRFAGFPVNHPDAPRAFRRLKRNGLMTDFGGWWITEEGVQAYTEALRRFA